MAPKRVLIVDDHPAVREGLALLISRQPDLSVCGEAADVGEALDLMQSTSPDVAVIDIALKKGNGIDLIKRVRSREDQVRIVVLSMYSELLYAESALRAGAMGYVNKEEATGTILKAIRSVLEGRVYLSERFANQFLSRAVGHRGATVEKDPIQTLSDRELEVFQLIGQGLGTQTISEKMQVSPKTVETYRARIKDKLHVTHLNELLFQAFLWSNRAT